MLNTKMNLLIQGLIKVKSIECHVHSVVVIEDGRYTNCHLSIKCSTECDADSITEWLVDEFDLNTAELETIPCTVMDGVQQHLDGSYPVDAITGKAFVITVLSNVDFIFHTLDGV